MPSTYPRLPPIVPTNAVALDRAIVLLGARTKGDLNANKLTELVGLVGRYPDAMTAAVWKSELKRVRRDELFERAG